MTDFKSNYLEVCAELVSVKNDNVELGKEIEDLKSRIEKIKKCADECHPKMGEYINEIIRYGNILTKDKKEEPEHSAGVKWNHDTMGYEKLEDKK